LESAKKGTSGLKNNAQAIDYFHRISHGDLSDRVFIFSNQYAVNCRDRQQRTNGFSITKCWSWISVSRSWCMGCKKFLCFTLSRAMLVGLIGYLFLSSLVDFYAYTQSIVNAASIPSIAFRVLLGIAILWLAIKDMTKK
jgi:hypothetical protein